jgi:hypothetical protein
VSSTKKLFVEIAKVKPDVVVIDLRLYEKIEGIDTSGIMAR